MWKKHKNLNQNVMLCLKELWKEGPTLKTSRKKGRILEIHKTEDRKMIKQISKAKMFGFLFIKMMLRKHQSDILATLVTEKIRCKYSSQRWKRVTLLTYTPFYLKSVLFVVCYIKRKKKYCSNASNWKANAEGAAEFKVSEGHSSDFKTGLNPPRSSIQTNLNWYRKFIW